MRNIIATTIVASICMFGFVACGDEEEEVTQEETEEETQEETQEEETEEQTESETGSVPE